MFLSKLYRQMYAGTGISTDSARRKKSKTWARWTAKQCRKLFVAKPMPDLQSPRWDPALASPRLRVPALAGMNHDNGTTPFVIIPNNSNVPGMEAEY